LLVNKNVYLWGVHKKNVIMKTKVSKAKEPVRMRLQKLANGNKSIYLDTYINGKRSYEYLKLYLTPEKTSFDKEQNEQTWATALEIKSQRIIDIQRESNNLPPLHGGKKQNIRLVDYARKVADMKKTIETKHSYNTFIFYLHAFKSEITFKHVDKQFCLDFLEYLKTTPCKKTSKSADGICLPLSANSRFLYCKLLKAVLHRAVEDGILPHNPFDMIKHELLPKATATKRTYLTIDEVRLIEATETPYKNVKAGFLFGCYTGLRFSDIKALTWGQIRKDGDKTTLCYVQKKTSKQEYLPLAKPAVELLERLQQGKDSDLIFVLPRNNYVNVNLKRIAAAAGINSKKITFHTSRHTVATLLISKNVPIEVVSKILGHSAISTTQIYAKVVGRQLEEGMHRLDNL